ncbi:hypothetical protein PN462_21085 [Spirulina sp. CS-785/01]|uniref:hypothetical protein n=1 Tax=Spirulina sp. CS-785/01 TaxID=3021716 RepID=UPI00232B3E80|nr:hypothetical protein [Spirulina sp. CS-785/01]MDB9315621.1 hypothetical protein [Spirulina sp. CS-785/01]
MITIPSKSDKERSVILDAFRILAWQQYKQENEVSGLEGYELFESEWKQHEVHGSDLTQLTQLATQLGYSLQNLKQIRQDYYAKNR